MAQDTVTPQYRTLKEIIQVIESRTQEEQKTYRMCDFINSAIREVNMRLGLLLPIVDESQLQQQYMGLGEP